MLDEDIGRVESFLDLTRDSWRVTPVLLLSPSSQELDLLRRNGIAMEAYFREQWDLSSSSVPPGPVRNVALACNVFMCSPDPLLWMRNISRRARYLVIQDLIRARRSADAELAIHDGDVARYSFSSEGEEASVRSFDMSALVTVGPRIFYSYDGGRKFICAVDLGRLP